MTRKIRKNIVSILWIVILTMFFGKTCLNMIFTKTGETTSLSASEAIFIMEEANEIEICKNYRTIFYKDYSIIVDGKQVATVTGKFFKLFGDEFTLYSSNGEEIISEKEEVLHLNRQAQFYDNEGNKIGRLESKYFAILDKDTFYTQYGNKVARCDQKLHIPTKYIIYDDNHELYVINKNFLFDNYTLRVTDESVLDVTNAVMITCIEDAVHTSSKNSNSKKSNN